jgi:hypothetical protein
MKIAPIIHTRTLFCDFNSEFLVRPCEFMDADIKWARKNILGTTVDIDGLSGFRWVVLDNEKYRIAGVVGFLKDICLKLDLKDTDKIKSEELFCDNKGRSIYAFIGIVIDKMNTDYYESVSLEYLWSIYLDAIYPKWKSSYQEVLLMDFKEEELLAYNNVKYESISYEKLGEKIYYEYNAITDYKLFLYYSCCQEKQYFSFCSNILDYNSLKNSEFTILTTSQNNITRILRVYSKNTNDTGSIYDNEHRQNIDNNILDSNEAKYSKKKNWIVLGSCLMIFVIFIIMWLFIK